MEKIMRAMFNFAGNEGPTNAKNLGDKKETIGGMKLIWHDPKDRSKWSELVDARFYCGRSPSASGIHCSVWLATDNFYCSGSGLATGYGYHKQSAALAYALRSAGVDLYYLGEDNKTRTPAHIDGVGETAMRQAMYAVGGAMGKNRGDMYLVEY
jgi:hypothetical protein